MLDNLGRYDGAHGDHCRTHLCCRCPLRPWTTRLGDERLCGLCASCCLECGRAPARHLDGLDNGLCAECRGLCARCGNPRPAEDACRCRTWKRGPGSDPIGFIMQGFPQPLLQALGHRLPRNLPDILFAELAHRTPAQLLDRIERRWHTRWSQAIHERDEDNRLRWAPQEIAEFLVGRGPCPNPACEDGHLIHDATPLPVLPTPRAPIRPRNRREHLHQRTRPQGRRRNPPGAVGQPNRAQEEAGHPSSSLALAATAHISTAAVTVSPVLAITVLDLDLDLPAALAVARHDTWAAAHCQYAAQPRPGPAT